MDVNSPDIIICDCGLSEHQIIINYDKDFPNGYRQVTISPHLIHYNNILKRILVAIKYIFGYKCKYGAWDSIIISNRNTQPIKNIINFLEN